MRRQQEQLEECFCRFVAPTPSFGTVELPNRLSPGGQGGVRGGGIEGGGNGSG